MVILLIIFLLPFSTFLTFFKCVPSTSFLPSSKSFTQNRPAPFSFLQLIVVTIISSSSFFRLAEQRRFQQQSTLAGLNSPVRRLSGVFKAQLRWHLEDLNLYFTNQHVTPLNSLNFNSNSWVFGLVFLVEFVKLA